jgi:PD-(D/E)XK nuclease superfamily
MPSRISGSKLPLVSHCRAAFAPDVVWPGSPPGRPAIYGTAFHAAVELWYASGEVDLEGIAAKHGLSDEEAARLERAFDGWSTSRVASLSDATPEWGAGYDTATGTVVLLPRGEGRAAYDGLPSTVICGTLDLVRVDADSKTGEVHDWKTGRSKLPKAKDNYQLLFGAMLLARAYDLDTVRVYLHTVDEDGELRTSEGEVDAIEMDGIEAAVTRWQREATEGPTLNPGEHCTGLYCPIRATCSKTNEATDELAPVPLTEGIVYPLTGAIESPEQAMWILHRVKAVQAAVDLAEKAVRAYADERQGLEVDGKWWGRHLDTWTEPDLSTLDEAKLATLGRLGLHEAVEHKLGTTKLKAALKERGLKGKALEAAYDFALEELTEANMTKTRTRAVYAARKNRPEPVVAGAEEES